MIIPYQSFFQDPYTVLAFQSIELHDIVFYYIVLVVVFVSYFVLHPALCKSYNHPFGSNIITLEVVWTVVPL